MSNPISRIDQALTNFKTIIKQVEDWRGVNATEDKYAFAEKALPILKDLHAAVLPDLAA